VNTICWEPEYILGYDPIDIQHKEWINKLESIYNTINSGKFDKNDRIEFQLLRLQNHMKFHLLYEEKLMEENCYPGLSVHKTLHDGILTNIVYFISRIDIHDIIISPSLINEKIHEHILIEDKAFISFLFQSSQVLSICNK
jgi:hemerythrin-like metal-binding protein